MSGEPEVDPLPAPSPLPLFVRLAGRRVLVVGAGAVAARKIAELREAGAAVLVVAPEAAAAVEELAARGAIELERRPFEERDVDGAWLVVSATGDPGVQRRVFAAAERDRRFVLAVDDPAHGSAASGSVIRRPPFLVAISSSGEAPALTRLLREVLERALPDESWIREARALRARWKRDGVPMGSRFGELLRAFRERRGDEG